MVINSPRLTVSVNATAASGTFAAQKHDGACFELRTAVTRGTDAEAPDPRPM